LDLSLGVQSRKQGCQYEEQKDAIRKTRARETTNVLSLATNAANSSAPALSFV
jgi:hypothetical protein